MKEANLGVAFSESHKEGVKHIHQFGDVVEVGNVNVSPRLLRSVSPSIVKLEQLLAPVRQLDGLDKKVQVYCNLY